jgi:hypothetical protein
MLKQFSIDENYITDVIVSVETSSIKDRNNPTHDDIIKILKGHDRMIWTSNKDHDEFTQLREELGRLGYIKIERGWWNGDRVLKSFKLNEWTFRKDHKFPSAGALSNSIHCARQYGWKNISSY